MGLRETPRSLRAYFIVFGGLGLVGVLIGIGTADADTMHLPLDWKLTIWLPLGLRLLESAALLWAGITLPTALVRGARWIKSMLIASGVLLFAEGAFITAVRGSESEAWDLGLAAVGLAITIYLYRSAVRLSAEAIARAGLPTEPPAARVV